MICPYYRTNSEYIYFVVLEKHYENDPLLYIFNFINCSILHRPDAYSRFLDIHIYNNQCLVGVPSHSFFHID